MKTSASSSPPGSAPDIKKNYPSGGGRIGPAWQAMWTLLERRPYRRTDMQQLAYRWQISPITVGNLLWTAAAHGLLIKTDVYDDRRKRWVVEYRRADRPEKA